MFRNGVTNNEFAELLARSSKSKEKIQGLIGLLGGKEKNVEGDGLCLTRATIASLFPDYENVSVEDAVETRRNSLDNLRITLVRISNGSEINVHQFCSVIPGLKSSYYFSDEDHIGALTNLYK